VAQHSRQPLPDTIESAIRQLKHCGIDIDYYTDNLKSNAHWTYEPDEKKSYHRLLLRHNFAANCRGYWTETNCARAQTHGTFWHRNEFAYPINTLAKPNHVTTITNWAKLQNIVPVGRWGTWEHLNSDVAVEQAVQTANTALMYE
jgi:UDP-galactopyranose mutase